MPVPSGTRLPVAVGRGRVNGGLPSWKLKLFQKISLSTITLRSGGGNFSESSALGTMPTALL